MSDTGNAELSGVLSPRDEIEAQRDVYLKNRTRDLNSSINIENPDLAIEQFVDYLWSSSSKPHILTCAAQGEASAAFAVENFGDLEFGGEVAKNVATEIVDVMGFERELDEFIGDFLVVDSLTYDEVYTNIDSDDKANIQQIYRNPKRGIYPNVTEEIKKLRTKAGNLDVELRSRVNELGINDGDGQYGSQSTAFKDLTTEALMQAFDGAIDANTNGDVSVLDENMKKIVEHFATGDFLVWDVSTQNWKERLQR